MESVYFDQTSKKKRTIYEADLNIDRTNRIYKTLEQ